MLHLLAHYDPKAELWRGKIEGMPIHTEAASLDDLVAQVWSMLREQTDDQVDEFTVIARVDRSAGSLLETTHLMRSPANASRLDEALADIAAGKVVKREL
jgi:hypothetical protein